MNLISQALNQSLDQLGVPNTTIELERPEPQYGDYTTNIAMKLAKTLGKNPRELAKQIVDTMLDQHYDWLSGVEIAGPGFINITLADDVLYGQVSASVPQIASGMNYVVEYSCPNAFKELHAGHLYQTIAGDVIARMLEQAGSEVHRTNFGGDVGLHVAKAMWGIIDELGGEYPDKLNSVAEAEQSAFLRKAYVAGAKAYESDDEARVAIDGYNKQVYSVQNTDDHSSEFAQIYWTCRQWSYDYFDRFYKSIQVNLFTYYPESTTAKPGLELVEQGKKSGIFEESDGAIVYRGEKIGLHTRVFVTKAGLPTYETKDLGVIYLELNEFNFDHRILITGREQTEYMKVVFTAAGELMPSVKGVMTHLTNGLIKFGDGQKMSSRLGNVTSATDVLDIVSDHIPADNPKDVRNALMLGAVKYAFLKQRLGGDIAFDPESSVSLQGNSGPYLQYALVRARSILAKSSDDLQPQDINFEPDERKMAQKLSQFQDVLTKAIQEYAPHILCTYMYELASEFNVFYEHNRVLDHERSAIRLMIVSDYEAILDKGLELLGIERIERM